MDISENTTIKNPIYSFLFRGRSGLIIPLLSIGLSILSIIGFYGLLRYTTLNSYQYLPILDGFIFTLTAIIASILGYFILIHIYNEKNRALKTLQFMNESEEEYKTTIEELEKQVAKQKQQIDDTQRLLHEEITSRMILESDLRDANHMIELGQRLKSSLMANMSHEFRGPMSGIIGFAGMLKDDADDQETIMMLDKIIQSSKRLMKTLNSILELSQVEIRRNEFVSRYINTNEVVAEVIGEFRPLADDKKLKLGYTSNDGYHVFADKDMLGQVLRHIIDNSIKFTDEGSVNIEILNAKIEGKTWIDINIKDTGIGIKKEYHEIVFQEFRQASEGTTRAYDGAGLGLTIAKRMVEVMDGKIKLESTPNEGSNFTVRLPGVGIKSKSTEIKEKNKEEHPANPDFITEVSLFKETFIN